MLDIFWRRGGREAPVVCQGVGNLVNLSSTGHFLHGRSFKFHNNKERQAILWILATVIICNFLNSKQCAAQINQQCQALIAKITF